MVNPDLFSSNTNKVRSIVFGSARSVARDSWAPITQRLAIERLTELSAAATLAEMGFLPPARCHPLTGDRDGQFAVDAGPLMRVIFEPAHDPIPRRPDGGIDLANITAIVILEVIDYHG
jgi:proteic killer suppression protein